MHHDHEAEAGLFHRGIELFNAGEWFEAHEVWEDLWRLSSGQRKRFMQGLIQAAVVLEHIRRGNPRGVRSVYATCQAKFEGLEGVYMGIDVARLLADLRRVVEPILNLPPEVFDPALPRGQKLPFDPAQAPRIDLTCDPFAEEAQ